MTTLPLRCVVSAAAALFLILPGALAQTPPPAPGLEAGFAAPPEDTKPYTFWYWVSDNISKPGITRDLEAMARVGIGEAYISNVDVNPQHRGTVKVLSEEWWSCIEHAIREGGRLGVKIGIFNCPGWSQSGGPWVSAQQTMRHLVSSETRVHGPQTVEVKLPAPADPFQDVAVLAFPAPRLDSPADNFAARRPRLTATPANDSAALLFDGDPAAACPLPDARSLQGQPFVIDAETAEPFTARSLTLHFAGRTVLDCEVQAADEAGVFHTMRTVHADRSNLQENVGPRALGPVAVSFPPVTSRRFRFILTRAADAPAALSELELGARPRLERFVEKSLGKMFQTPLPLWDAYLWPTQAEPDAPGLAIPPAAVVDLTGRLGPDGTLRWDAPAGDWVILRTGMTPTGVHNSPASPEATGYEIDKMSRALIGYHFDSYVGKLLARIPAAERAALRHVAVDSYEQGSENWTDGFAQTFRARYGYDPLPFLPVFTGRLVGGADQSERFLWDLRRLVADRVASEYVAGLRDKAREHGLSTWLENYGHWGFPGEFLQYGGQSAEIAGEFWTSGDLGSIELRAAASAAHTYGQPVVHAEAFTSGGPAWALDPWALKRKTDWAATEGVNHFVLHVYIQQPGERAPGVNAPFGTEFNRHNPWFNQAGGWLDYLRRCHFLLQQGQYVADVAYFIGEDAPKMTGTRQPTLPPGYSFDYINTEVIEQKLQVREGRFVLPGGQSYRVLVLPPLAAMRPECLRKIRDLVAAGGTVLGAPPSRSPSLENYPAADREVARLAGELWADCDGRTRTDAAFGQGRVFRNVDLPAVFAKLALPPDLTGLPKDGSVPWIHRATAEGDIYFLSNQSDQPTALTANFRVAGRQPELWDAVTGERRGLPDFHQENGRTLVPLEFAPRQAYFVLFRHPAPETADAVAPAKNFPELASICELTGPWEAVFDPKAGGSGKVSLDALTDWTKFNAPDKFYSGTATYRLPFEMPAALYPAGDQRRRLYLDLGAVHSLGRVRLNGQDMGLIWCAPWRTEVTRAIRQGRNELEIEVTNTWANRIIGDQSLPVAEHFTEETLPLVTKETPLVPSGLLGPVRLLLQ